MYFLTYVSSAVTPFSNEQLRDLLVISERNNWRDEISGMLLYKDGNFMQVLEGAEQVVLRTHARIASDSRHGGLITLLQGPQRRQSDSSSDAVDEFQKDYVISQCDIWEPSAGSSGISHRRR